MNMNGQIVRQMRSLNNGIITLEVSDLIPGMYYLRVDQDGFSKGKKFIVE